MSIGSDKYFGSISDIAGKENLVKFEGFYQNRYVEPFITGYSFTFVTRPSLFILPVDLSSNTLEKLAYDNMKRDAVFSQFITVESLNDSDSTIAEQLSYHDSNNSKYGSFLPIITNRLKSFSTIDVNMEQRESYETKQGYRFPVPTFKTQSEATNSLSLNCIETSNLDLTKIMTLWVNYISNVTDGTFYGNPEMIRKGIIDYMSSIYYFILEPDGKTLKYWAKYTGCWPTLIPYSQLNYSKGDQAVVETDLQFVYTTKEDMNPSILEDFNKTSLLLTSNQSKDTDIETSYTSPSRSPFLNKDKLIALIAKNNGIRGPIVFYNGSASASQQSFGKFELAFNKESFEDLFTENKFEETYFDTEDQLISDLDK